MYKVGDKLRCLEDIDNLFGWPLFVKGEIYEVLYVDDTDVTLNHKLYASKLLNHLSILRILSSSPVIFIL